MNNLLKIKEGLDNFIKKAIWARRENYVLYRVERSKPFLEMKTELTRSLITQCLMFLRTEDVKIEYQKRVAHIKEFPEHERVITDDDVKAISAIVKKHLPLLKDIVDDNIIFQSYIYFANRGGQASLDKKHNQEAKKAVFSATFNLKNKNVINRLLTKSNLLITSISETTENWLTKRLLEGEEDGLDWSEVADKVRERVPEYYDGRADTIVKTEMANVVNEIEMETAVRNEASTKIWNSAGMNICDDCEMNDSEEVGINDVFPSGDDRPPIHPNCVAGDTIVLSPDARRMMRIDYSGELIELSFADGTFLTVSPYHIILTTRGYVFACNLKSGDKVIKAIFSEGVVLSNPNDNNSPSVISQVFDTFWKSFSGSAKSMPVSSEDFHGDGKFGNGNVDIISSNSFLRDCIDSSFSEKIRKVFLNRSCPQLKAFSSKCNFETMLIALATASDGIMSGHSIKSIFSRSSIKHHCTISLRNTTNYNARIKQASANSNSANIERMSDIFLSLAGLITTNDIINIKIKSVSHKFVYDLDTTSTLYTCNSIITSNCKCLLEYQYPTLGTFTNEWAGEDD